jgi:hypothetical protein
MTNMSAIVSACVTECERQQVGLDRVGRLIQAYAYAIEQTKSLPKEHDLFYIAGLIEPANKGGYRATPVTFENGGSSAPPRLIPNTIKRLFEVLDWDVAPDVFTRSLLQIHPFSEGNGRTAFVIYNWLSRTLDNPLPLPDYFGDSK